MHYYSYEMELLDFSKGFTKKVLGSIKYQFVVFWDICAVNN